MIQHVLDERVLRLVTDFADHPELVTADVEDMPGEGVCPVWNEVHAVERLFHLAKALGAAGFQSRVPGAQRRFGLWLFGPEGAKGGEGQNAHDLSISQIEIYCDFGTTIPSRPGASM